MDLSSHCKHHPTSVQCMQISDYTVCIPYVCSTECTSLQDTTDNVQQNLKEGNKTPQAQKNTVLKSLGRISFVAAPFDFRLR